jgi:pimeloyl-ACP methyl ester carboxylesterase
MKDFELTRLAVAGIDTAVLTAGSGEPLVFFHGGGTAEGFDCFLPLAERYRLIVPYHPGFGLSGDARGFASVDDYVRHYADLFTALGVDTLVLAGLSWGGWVASSFAAAHPQRVRGLALSAPYGLEAPGNPLANVGALSPDELLAHLTRDPAVFAGRVPVPLDEPFIAAQAREIQSAGRIMTGPFDPTLERKLAGLTMPTLLLWGDDDQVIPISYAEVWEAALPNCRSIVFPGRGHLLFYEDLEAVARVSAFADELP